MTRRELLDRMDSDELSEWIAFYRVRIAKPKPNVEAKLQALFGKPEGEA